MAVLIDASILIDCERGRLELDPYVEARPDEEAFISVVTASELLHGVHRALSVERRARRSAFVEAILERFTLLDIDPATARAHARIWADLATAGTKVGPHDMWLAAACIAHGLVMVTSDAREFEQVPGLVVETWISI